MQCNYSAKGMIPFGLFSCKPPRINLFFSFDSGTQADMAIVDLSKAFDSILHSKLLHKHYGIARTAFKCLEDFLTRWTMVEVLDDKTSREVPADSGAPRGMLLLLNPYFSHHVSCHINNLPASVKSKVHFFAFNDYPPHKEVKTFSDHIILQNGLKQLEKQAKDRGMNFNPTRCYILSIKQKNKSNFFYNLNSVILDLECINRHPYLGFTISNDLKSHLHISTDI